MSDTPDNSAALTTPLDLLSGPVELTRQLVDIASPSHHEEDIADALEQAFVALCATGDLAVPLSVNRVENNLLVSTDAGHPTRVILAGHIDTVPVADNVPCTKGADSSGRETLFGCGTVDMKSGDAVFASVLAELAVNGGLTRDVSLIFYQAEEVAERFNGLGKISGTHPEWLEGDVAILGEPSGAVIEAGCQGTIRLKVIGHGRRAHSARSWMGHNAFHELAPVIGRIAAYSPRQVDIDGCGYREGINITWAECGVATNTIPDRAWFFVNYRFAPDRSVDEAMAHLLEVMGLDGAELTHTGDNREEDYPSSGITVEIDDACAGALPGLSQPAAAELVAATGGQPRAKFGWTDVARFSALGIPAVNFGPGDPSFCHRKDEQCPVEMIDEVAAVMRRYLGGFDH
ncbi:succinyl-diaminopimelate desuccinylase [Corynebacterium mendelii]|uniref:succinyl-diaminopimelate desuccinylase n=1 Tax=Corynebacterium mendelii TaxID=2765362 RepID=UPI002ED6BF21